MTLASLDNEPSSRDRILDVAESLFARRGYAGVGMKEVADGASLGKSSVFHHFKSKAELYSAACVRILGAFEDRLLRSLAEGGTPSVRLERCIGDLIDVLVAHPTHARLLLRSLFEDDDLPQDGPEGAAVYGSIQNIMGPMAKLLREGMSAGEFRLASVSHVLLLLIGPIVFPFASGDFGEQLLGKDVFDPAQVRRIKGELLDLVRVGLSAPNNAREE